MNGFCTTCSVVYGSGPKALLAVCRAAMGPSLVIALAERGALIRPRSVHVYGETGWCEPCFYGAACVEG